MKLSEVKNRFRVRNGEIEIEYEGPLKEVNERYSKALEWALSQKKRKLEEAEEEEPKGGKKSKRGGLRKAIFPQEIQKLKKAIFFKPKKSLDETIKKLESMGVPTRGKRTAIRNALISDIRKENSTLKGTKEGDEWFFWQD